MTGSAATELPRATGTRLRRHPVHGSVVLGLLPSQPQPRAAWASLLPVSVTSPAKARGQAKKFLTHCGGIPSDLIDVSVLLASEFVTNAYAAMSAEPFPGIACIDFSLRLFDDHLLIEVIDSSPRIPVPDLTDNSETEGGRGLAVVERMSQEWGFFWRNGRKVVFCKLGVPSTEYGIESER